MVRHRGRWGRIPSLTMLLGTSGFLLTLREVSSETSCMGLSHLTQSNEGGSQRGLVISSKSRPSIMLGESEDRALYSTGAFDLEDTYLDSGLSIRCWSALASHSFRLRTRRCSRDRGLFGDIQSSKVLFHGLQQTSINVCSGQRSIG